MTPFRPLVSSYGPRFGVTAQPTRAPARNPAPAPAPTAIALTMLLTRFGVASCTRAEDVGCHTGRGCSLSDLTAASGRLKVKALGATRGISAAGTPALEDISIAIPR